MHRPCRECGDDGKTSRLQQVRGLRQKGVAVGKRHLGQGERVGGDARLDQTVFGAQAVGGRTDAGNLGVKQQELQALSQQLRKDTRSSSDLNGSSPP
jgi:hypothetical protein